jgi:hypothetical protein
VKSKKHTAKFIGLIIIAASARLAAPAGTAFTYQGQLLERGTPANGNYDLQFALYDAATAGAQLGPTLTNAAVEVSNGLFAAAVDFGAGVFTGEARWLEIAVRTNGGGGFTLLIPRQSVTATPYALQADSVSASHLTGTLLDAQLSANVPRLSANQTFSGAVQFNNATVRS